MELIEIILNGAVAGYLLIGSPSEGFLLMKTGWKKISLLEPPLRMGWAIIAGAIYWIVSFGAAYAMTLFIPETNLILNSAITFPAMLLAGIGLLSAKNLVKAPAKTATQKEKEQKPMQQKQKGTAPEQKIPQQKQKAATDSGQEIPQQPREKKKLFELNFFAKKVSGKEKNAKMIAQQALEKLHEDREYLSMQSLDKQQVEEMKKALKKMNKEENEALGIPAKETPETKAEAAAAEKHKAEWSNPFYAFTSFAKEISKPRARHEREKEKAPEAGKEGKETEKEKPKTSLEQIKVKKLDRKALMERRAQEEEERKKEEQAGKEAKSVESGEEEKESKISSIKEGILRQISSAAKLNEAKEAPESLEKTETEISEEVFTQISSMKKNAEEIALNKVSEFKERENREPTGRELDELAENLLEQLKRERLSIEGSAESAPVQEIPESRRERRFMRHGQQDETQQPQAAQPTHSAEQQQPLSRREQRMARLQQGQGMQARQGTEIPRPEPENPFAKKEEEKSKLTEADLKEGLGALEEKKKKKPAPGKETEDEFEEGLEEEPENEDGLDSLEDLEEIPGLEEEVMKAKKKEPQQKK